MKKHLNMLSLLFVILLATTSCSTVAENTKPEPLIIQEQGSADDSQGLDAKQESIVAISAFIANDNAEKLQAAFNEGLDTGLTVNEIKEIIIQMSVYCGFPRSIASSRVLLQVFEEREKQGIVDESGKESSPLPAGKTSLELGTEIQAMLTQGLVRPQVLGNSFNPALDQLLRVHNFGDIWGRDGLDHKSRQIATIAALSSMRHTQLRGNMVAGFNIGLNDKQMEGIVSVLGSKVSWRAGDYARGILKGIMNERSVSVKEDGANQVVPFTADAEPKIAAVKSKVPTVTLNNGVEMPVFGMGTYRIADLEECEQAVSEAIAAGYRLFDTAALYKNEEAVGRAIKRSGIPREEFFVTTKLWISDTGYENTKRAFETSLKNLGFDYIDLYLIHQPYNDAYGSWRAMEELYKEGKVRAIGISNFPMDRMIDIAIFNEVPPAVNQIEIHPFYQRPEEVEYMKKNNIQPQGYSPLVAGRNNIFENRTLREIGAKYGKSVAQVILRWHVQRGICVFPKSTNKAHIEENIDIFDFALNDEDIAKIAALDTNTSVYFSQTDPEVVKQFRDFAN
ncbi:MAG: aldo/keto reductase [Treponema sp.]|jgi:diketogulonate reductase-like aldo/keto reductase/alkylhydroperoxidase/carboxymuconolactone decarboxylase family protein YurZ|nr:aldo/keto reductase [Treponema sp.]